MKSNLRWGLVSDLSGASQKRIVVLCQLDQKRWAAQCPSLPGCLANGENKLEALVEIQKRICAYLDELVRHNLPVPAENFDTAVIEIF